MIFVYCDMGRSPDLDCQYYKHTELEKSATIRETGRVPITSKVIFSFSFSNLGIEYNLGFVRGIIILVQTKV